MNGTSHLGGSLPHDDRSAATAATEIRNRVLMASNLAQVSGLLDWTTSLTRAQPKMSENSFPPGEILELIKGQARLETKLDQFFSAQTVMKTEIDGLKADITAVKTDVAEIKTQRRETKSYFNGVTAVVALAAGGFTWLVSQFLDPLMKKFFGI